jgi:hypothetical protein
VLLGLAIAALEHLDLAVGVVVFHSEVVGLLRSVR